MDSWIRARSEAAKFECAVTLEPGMNSDTAAAYRRALLFRDAPLSFRETFRPTDRAARRAEVVAREAFRTLVRALFAARRLVAALGVRAFLAFLAVAAKDPSVDPMDSAMATRVSSACFSAVIISSGLD
jgi:hypothetical protein